MGEGLLSTGPTPSSFYYIRPFQQTILCQVEKLHISVADWLWSLKLLQASKATMRKTRLTKIPRGNNRTVSSSPADFKASQPDRDQLPHLPQLQHLESIPRDQHQPLESTPRDPTILPQTVLAHSSPFIQVYNKKVSPKGCFIISLC